MLVFEYKAYGKQQQFDAVDEVIRTVQFVRNKCLRLWMDRGGNSQYDLNKYCTILAEEYPFADELNSMARQASAERAWSAIAKFYAALASSRGTLTPVAVDCGKPSCSAGSPTQCLDNCKKQMPGKKGYPQFQHDNRSVEYKTSGWKLASSRSSITFTDKKGIGKLKLKGTRDLHFYQPEQIKRIRLVKRADGYYVQFCIQVDRSESVEPSGIAIGLDVGLSDFYTDSNGKTVDNPRFLRKGEQRLKKAQRLVSKRVKKSSNRRKARLILGKRHLKISRQRKDHAVKLARCVITSNDVVAYEDLRIKNMVKNHNLAKSINDASWYMFRVWLEYFGKVFGKITIAVMPNGTSQECSSCGAIVKKTLSTRTHVCACGCALDRDENAARNILSRGLSTVGHTGTLALDASNAWGEATSTLAGAILSEQVAS